MWSSELKGSRIHEHFQTKTGATVTFRSPLPTDLDSFLEFGNDMAAEYETDPNLGIGNHQRMTREAESEWLEKLLKEIELQQQIGVVAVMGDKIIGFTRVGRGRQEDVLHYGVLHISVAKAFRDLGLGYKMIQIALGECEKLGIWLISLEVFEINFRAIHLYEKFDFKQTGRYPKKVLRAGKLLDTIIMCKELT